MAFGRYGRCIKLLYDVPANQLFRGPLQANCMGCRIGAKRHLLSEDIVKLQDFQQKKLAVAHLASGSEGNYFDLFNRKLQKNELILKDELKLLLHLCQSANDMVTARDAIYRYHEENKNLAFGEFKFGPLFMRLCYELGLEEMAAATLTDKNMRGFFNDSTSFNIAIDMLFTKGCYESALEVLGEMRNQGVPFNKDTFTLALGTCYKLNTAESYKICSTVVEEGKTKGHSIPRHAYCFAVALALKQNDIDRAESFYSEIMNTNSRLCQNLRVMTLAMQGKVDDATSILSAAVMPDSPAFIKRIEFAQEVVDLLRLQSKDSPPSLATVEQLLSQLQQAGQVSQMTMDQMLCSTPTGKRKPLILVEQRRISRRTLKPLHSVLLTE